MLPHGTRSRLWSLFTLKRTRLLLLGVRYRLLVGAIALGYALGAMLYSGMLYIPARPERIGAFFFVDPSGTGPSWTYPAILAGGPYFQVDLPILSTILMTLSAAGIGLGMALAVFLGVRLLRQRKALLLKPAGIGSVAGVTPALIALVTLGACCSTTAAATAGIGLGYHSSLLSSATQWMSPAYLGLVQVVVVFFALLAQEYLVGVYALWLGASTEAKSGRERAVPTAKNNREHAPGRDLSN